MLEKKAVNEEEKKAVAADDGIDDANIIIDQIQEKDAGKENEQSSTDLSGRYQVSLRDQWLQQQALLQQQLRLQLQQKEQHHQQLLYAQLQQQHQRMVAELEERLRQQVM